MPVPQKRSCLLYLVLVQRCAISSYRTCSDQLVVVWEGAGIQTGRSAISSPRKDYGVVKMRAKTRPAANSTPYPGQIPTTFLTLELLTSIDAFSGKNVTLLRSLKAALQELIVSLIIGPERQNVDCGTRNVPFLLN